MQLDFYEKANDYMINSWKSWENGKTAKSWGYTIPARFAYLCETIINLVKLPFAIIAVTFGALHALCTCNRKSEIFQTTYSAISKTTNHLFLPVLGSLISPAAAHKYRDANITPYLIAARIIIISGGLFYAFMRK